MSNLHIQQSIPQIYEECQFYVNIMDIPGLDINDDELS